MNFGNISATTATPFMSSSTVEPEHPRALLGYAALTLSVLFFGTNYLPVKQFRTGDGMFFQLILTTGIWSTGFVVYAIRDFPKFYALPMLGGLFWSTGNITVVPIIKTIGIGLGVLFWSAVLLINGWAIARFGLFGVKPEVPSNEALNYAGVALCAVSGLFYLLVKSESQLPDDARPLTGTPEDGESVNNNDVDNRSGDGDSFFMDHWSPAKKRIAGITMACVAGVLYAVTFTPALYVQDNYPGASQNALDYVFPFYTGIYLTSIFYFAVYCVISKNKPKLYPQIVLPGLISGWMWACANSCFFFANNALTQSVTFPIVSSGPSAVSMFWGVVLYKEIKGFKNLLILSIGFLFALAGSILCGVSK